MVISLRFRTTIECSNCLRYFGKSVFSPLNLWAIFFLFFFFLMSSNWFHMRNPKSSLTTRKSFHNLSLQGLNFYRLCVQGSCFCKVYERWLVGNLITTLERLILLLKPPTHCLGGWHLPLHQCLTSSLYMKIPYLILKDSRLTLLYLLGVRSLSLIGQ